MTALDLLADGEIGPMSPAIYGVVGLVIGLIIGAVAVWLATKRPALAEPEKPAGPLKPSGSALASVGLVAARGPAARFPDGRRAGIQRRPNWRRGPRHSPHLPQGTAGSPGSRAHSERRGRVGGHGAGRVRPGGRAADGERHGPTAVSWGFAASRLAGARNQVAMRRRAGRTNLSCSPRKWSWLGLNHSSSACRRKTKLIKLSTGA